MLELTQMGPVTTILLIVAICGALSYGVTQALKMIVLWWDVSHHGQWWFNIAMRLLSVIVGGVSGYLLLPSTVGFLLGTASGVLNTTIVAVIKSKLKEIPTNPMQSVVVSDDDAPVITDGSGEK